MDGIECDGADSLPLEHGHVVPFLIGSPSIDISSVGHLDLDLPVELGN